MPSPLTFDAILAISTRNNHDMQPLVQVIDIRQIGNPQTTQERFRLVLSDGNYLQQAMLATQLNELIKSGNCIKYSCVRLREYICNTVQNKKIIIVLNMEVEILNAEPYGEPIQVPMTDDKGLAGSGNVQQPPTPSLAPRPPPQQPYSAASNGPRPGSTAGSLNSVPEVREGPPFSYNGMPPNGGGLQGLRGMAGAGGAALSSGYPVGGGYNNAGGESGTGYGGGGGGGYNSAGGAGQATYGRGSNQPQPVFTGRGPIVRNEAPARIVPIRSLNPYQGRWTIRARVTGKSPLKSFNRANGSGHVFSFDLLDGDGGEIRACCFNDVARTLHGVIEVGRVYTVSKGTLKSANRQYNHLKNEWELNLDSSTVVEPSADDSTIPQQQYSFVPISSVEDLDNNTMVDVIGIVVSVNPTATIMRKTGQETQKRTLHLRDKSGKSVEVTMWGEFCNMQGHELQELCDSGQSPVLLVKAGRISDFSGKSVGTVSSSMLLINPDIQEAHLLREWFDREGKHVSCQSVSKEGVGARSEVRKTVAQIKDEGLGRSGKPDWIAVRATVSFIKPDNAYYTACPLKSGDRQCNKKVTGLGDGTWRCERCNQNMDECDYRYMLSLQVQDHSGTTWLTAFQEPGEELMEMPPKELHRLKEEENPKYGDVFRSISLSQRVFKLKVFEDNYNDEQRVKCNVVKSERLNYVQESELLLDLIGKLIRGEPIHTMSTANTVGASGGGFASFEGDAARQPSNSFAGGASFSQGDYRQSSYDNNMYGGGGGGAGGGGGGGGGSRTGCFTCGSEGHYSRDCPSANTRGGGGGNFGGGFDTGYGGGGSGARGNNNVCFKCNEPGHWASSCPKQGGGGASRGSTGRGYGGGYGGGYNSSG